MCLGGKWILTISGLFHTGRHGEEDPAAPGATEHTRPADALQDAPQEGRGGRGGGVQATGKGE